MGVAWIKGKASMAESAAGAAATAFSIALGALMGRRVGFEFAAGRIAAGLLFGGQALVQERTLSTALGRSTTIQATLVRASYVLHDVAMGTHQLPVRIPDKGLGVKDARRAGSAAHGDPPKDAVRFQVLMDRVAVKGAIQSDSLGQAVEQVLMSFQSGEDDRGFGPIQRFKHHRRDNPVRVSVSASSVKFVTRCASRERETSSCLWSNYFLPRQYCQANPSVSK